MQPDNTTHREIVYKDDFITIVKEAYEVDGGGFHESSLYGGGSRTIVSKGMIRYWLYNSDMSVMFYHSEHSKKYGYKSISEPKEGIIKAEFADNQIYLFNIFGKLLKPFPFSNVSDFNNGFANVSIGSSGYGCLIDHSGNLMLKNSKNRIIVIPENYTCGAVIDDEHIALRPKGDRYYYLFTWELKPITLHEWNGDLHVNFESFEKGPIDWCIHFYNCSCLANRDVRARLCAFNLSTNKVCYTGSTNYDSSRGGDNDIYTPIGDNCIHHTSVVKRQEKEWDSDEHCYVTRNDDYVSETLYFKNGQFFSGYGRIEFLNDLQLILINGDTFIVNDNVEKTNSGCFSFSGDVIIPVIYSDLKLKDKFFEAKEGELTYKFNLQGQLIYKEKILPKEVNLYEELSDHKLLVRRYTRDWGNRYLYGIYDTKEDKYILPLEYSSISRANNNTIITCKEQKYGLLDDKYRFIIPCHYDSLEYITRDLYICSLKKESTEDYGIINRKGVFVIEAKYYKIHISGHNRLAFESHYYNPYCNRNIITDFALNTIASLVEGEEITLRGFWDLAGGFFKDYCRFVDSNNKWGIVNKESVIVSKNLYDSIDVVGIPNVFIGKNEESIYLINPSKSIEQQIDCDHFWTNQECYESGYIYISKNGDEGLMNTNGEVLLDCDYSSIGFDSDHFYLTKGDLHGMADLDGNIIIPCEYERFESLDNGYYIANNEFSYLLSPYGSIVTPPNSCFKAILETKAECLKTVTVDESGLRHYGLISKKGRLKRKTDLSYIGIFDSGRAVANVGGAMSLRYNSFKDRKELFLEGGKNGVIDENGNFVIEPIYNYIGIECEGYRSVSQNDGTANLFGVIKADGSPVIDCKYSYTRNVIDGLVVFAVGGEWRCDGWEKEKLRVMRDDKYHYLNGAKWGILDINGIIIIEPFADFMQVISEGKVTYRIDDKYGVLDLSTKTKQLTEYDYLSSFHEGRCIAGKFGKYHSFRVGYIKDDYSELVPCKYEKAYHFKDGQGVLESGRSQDTVNLDGEIIDSYTEDYPYDPNDDYDWERETWYALTDGQYGEYPGPGVDYDFLGY